jgi:microcompartment protein CcmK/EutM
VGEVVLMAAGSSARLTISTDGTPVDTVIMAIVDRVDLDGPAMAAGGR